MKTCFPSGAKSFVVVAALAALAGLAATGSAWPASDEAFQAATAFFAKASAGDDAALDPAAEAFEALSKAEPANPVLVAYAGASVAMKARATFSPLKKMSLAEDGLALIDKSLAMLTPAHDAPIQRGTPGSLEVRFVAANTFLAVPGFMNRGARGKKLLSDVLANPLFEKAPLGFQGSVWLRAGELAAKEQRGDDARRYLNEAITHNTPQADKARALLKGLPA